jgi:nickel/cobalt transporter (NiCoT) family protein
MRISRVTTKAIATVGMTVGANLAVWAVALLVFRRHINLLELGGVAYLLGLAHALDADHICAIDNVTRKLMQEGQRPSLVGFYFSLGHSTIVILLTIAIAVTAVGIQSHFDALANTGGLIGTLISAIFLFAIAAMNVLVLRSITQTFARIRRGEEYVDQDLPAILDSMGRIGRMVRPLLRLLDRSWKMYAVGFLLGLGFDTATQVGMLGISATAATHGMHIGDILMFPLLFTAGMCLVDTADGVLMLGAYGWAFLHPVRKLYYNMTITAVSVIVAFFVGGLEILGVVGDRFELQGGFWNKISLLNDDYHFGLIGVLIICIFVVSWITSIAIYRYMGYHKLEVAAAELCVDFAPEH